MWEVPETEQGLAVFQRVARGTVSWSRGPSSRDLKERREGGIHIWWKSIPGRGKSMCKGPEVGACVRHVPADMSGDDV